MGHPRRWNVVSIDDFQTGLGDLRGFGFEAIETETYLPKVTPTWLFNPEGDLCSRSATSLEQGLPLDAPWPLHLEVGSFHDAWKLMPRIVEHAEFLLIDVKLNLERVDETGVGTYADGREEALRLGKPILEDIRAEVGAANMQGVGAEEMLRRGGIFLYGYARRLLKGRRRPLDPNIVLCSGDEVVRAESAPYKFADLFDLRNKMELKGELEDAIEERQKRWLSQGVLSIRRIREELEAIRNLLERDQVDLSDAGRKEIEDRLRTRVGSNWEIGTFFWKQAVMLCCPPNMLQLDYRLMELESIERILGSVDWPKRFGAFVTRDHFDTYSHARDTIHTFAWGVAKDMTIRQAQEEKPERLDAAAQEMLDQWERLPCYGNGEVAPIHEKLVTQAATVRRDVSPDLLNLFANAKNIMRMRIGGFWGEIERAIEKSEHGKDLVLMKLARNVAPETWHPVKRLKEFRDISCELEFEKPVAVLPCKSFDTSGGLNLLGELLACTFDSIWEHGYRTGAAAEPHSVCLYLELDRTGWEWVVTVSQDGKGGECFPAYLLKKADMLDNGGSLTKMLSRVRNWIGVEIRSGGKARDPHIRSSVACKEAEKTLGGKVEYEYRVKLLDREAP